MTDTFLQEKHPVFDIHTYGMRIVDGLSKEGKKTVLTISHS